MCSEVWTRDGFKKIYCLCPLKRHFRFQMILDIYCIFFYKSRSKYFFHIESSPLPLLALIAFEQERSLIVSHRLDGVLSFHIFCDIRSHPSDLPLSWFVRNPDLHRTYRLDILFTKGWVTR